MNEDIRWKQRFENYQKAMSHLKQAVMIEDADIITQAATIQFFEVELISDAHTWLEALQKRNLTAHTYDEKSATEIYRLICSVYFPLLAAFEKRMKLIDAKT